MLEVLVATFPSAEGTEDVAQQLIDNGASQEDVCALEGPTRPQHDCGLIAVRTGPGHIDKPVAVELLTQAGGHPVTQYTASSDATVILKGLKQARDPFKSPETFLPPVLLEALRESEEASLPPSMASTRINSLRPAQRQRSL